MSGDKLKQQIIRDLAKSRGHLEYSYRKVVEFQFDHDFDEEELETLESFSSRFARLSDMIITRYFRILMRDKDPAFRGSVIDLLNAAEKFGWIDSAQTWRRIRELRNVAAHEYSAEDYKKLYQDLIGLAPALLAVSLTL